MLSSSNAIPVHANAEHAHAVYANAEHLHTVHITWEVRKGKEERKGEGDREKGERVREKEIG
jgi:hypothetical protein